MRHLVIAVCALALASCGGDEPAEPIAPATVPSPTVPVPPEPEPEVPPGGLAIGINEVNPNLIDPGRGDPRFVAWAERFKALRPAVGRVPVDWAGLQSEPGQPAQLSVPRDGCLRTTPPCAPYAGIRDQLKAYGAIDVPVMVVFYGVPPWGAAAPKGCERPGIEPRSRPINDRGLLAYRRLVRQVARLAKEEGAEVRWWSVWNEPNGPFFVSPQRARCSTDSPPVSVRPYARLARALRAELARMEGDPLLVVGELAGVANAGPRGTGVGEFLRALPRDVLCEADVLAQHEYAELPEDDDERTKPVDQAKAALRDRCAGRDIAVWITETGIGGPRAGQDRPTGSLSLRRQCQAYHRQLRAWHADEEIDLAIQYTFREDTAFPVGIADAGLTRTYPTYDLLAAWGNRKPADPPPPLPPSCKR